MQTIDMPVCSVMGTIWCITHLYGEMAFVKALLYLCRSSMEIQHALCAVELNFALCTDFTLVSLYIVTVSIDDHPFQITLFGKGSSMNSN